MQTTDKNQEFLVKLFTSLRKQTGRKKKWILAKGFFSSSSTVTHTLNYK